MEEGRQVQPTHSPRGGHPALPAPYRQVGEAEYHGEGLQELLSNPAPHNVALP